MENIEFIHGGSEFLLEHYPNANYVDGYDHMLYGIVPNTMQLLYTGEEFYDNLEIQDDDEGENMHFENLENHGEDFARNNLLLQTFIDIVRCMYYNKRPIIVHPSRIKDETDGTMGEL